MMRTYATLALALSLTACDRGRRGSSPDTDIIIGVDKHSVTLSLRNPTLEADPTEGVSSMRIDVVIDGEVMASESFDYPGGTAELSGIQEYGVVRFHVAGTDGSSVRSFGRSAEVVLEPAEDAWVPITFLPVNRVFPLAADLVEQRSDHRAITLPDGHVLLLGGHDTSRSSSITEVEKYDFYEGVFSAPGAYLPTGVAGAQTAWTSDAELLIIGGENIQTGPVADVSIYNPVQDTIESIATLTQPRGAHCAAQYMANGIVILGGVGTGTSADVLRYYTDQSSWISTSSAIQNGGSSEEVTACAAADDGQVFVQGSDLASTGTLDPFTGVGVGDGFDPIASSAAGTYVQGAALVQVEPNAFWLGGGVDLERDSVTSEGQEFRMDSASFVDGTALATPSQGAAWTWWSDDGWIAIAGGYSDVAGLNPVNKVELLNPATGEKGPTADLDRARPGLALSTLPDRSLLITGGYERGSGAGTPGAAIMVPYIDD